MSSILFLFGLVAICGFTINPSSALKLKNKNLLPNTDYCGIQGIDEFILGGEDVDLKELPWMVLLEYSKNSSTTCNCGGVLINKRYVLTAAHCVASENCQVVKVRLGEYNTESPIDCDNDGECAPPAQSIPIEEKIVHENYTSTNAVEFYCHHDIALFRLSKNVTFTDYIKPICLPITEELQSWSYDNNFLTTAGWGSTDSEVLRKSNVKLKLTLPIVDRASCFKHYSKSYPGLSMTSGQICAGGEVNKNICRGDSGGPLMAQHLNVKGRTNWYVVGLLSYGTNPCRWQYPGVFTRVSKYISWIDSKLKP